MLLELPLNHFPQAFCADTDCVVLLLHALGLESGITVELTSDPSAAAISALSRILADASDDRARRQAVSHGTLDRILLRLGELQAEEPRRPTRTKLHQAGDPVPAPVPPPPAEPTEEKQRHLWRPGYGTGEATSTRGDGKRDQVQKQKLERTILTVRCLTNFLAPIEAEPQDALWGEILDCLDASCLLRVLTASFFGVTVKVVVPQAALYHALLELVVVLAGKPALAPLLGDVQGMFKSVKDLVEGMKELCDDLVDDDPAEFAQVQDLPGLIKQALAAMAVAVLHTKPASATADAASAPSALAGQESENATYVEAMGPELFKDRDMRDPQGGYTGHHFAPLIDEDIRGKISNTRHRRLHRELKVRVRAQICLRPRRRGRAADCPREQPRLPGHPQRPAAALRLHHHSARGPHAPVRGAGGHLRPAQHPVRLGRVCVRRVLLQRVPQRAAQGEPANHGPGQGPVQSQPVPERQGVPEPARHVAGRGHGQRELGRRAQLLVPGPGVHPVGHPGQRVPALQRALRGGALGCVPRGAARRADARAWQARPRATCRSASIPTAGTSACAWPRFSTP
jgi:hypothetical protein